MKPDVPATPFKVDDPTSTWTSSYDSPETPVGQLTSTIHSSAQEMANVASLTRRGHRSPSSTAGGTAHWDGSATAGQQIPTSLHQYKTQNVQQNMFQQQVNQVDLEQLLESLVKARVHSMRLRSFGNKPEATNKGCTITSKRGHNNCNRISKQLK
jgi:hypothetical protein